MVLKHLRLKRDGSIAVSDGSFEFPQNVFCTNGKKKKKIVKIFISGAIVLSYHHRKTALILS